MELFISRTFPASVCLNCILKTSPEKNFTTYPGACQSDRETGKYEFLEESDFQKIHAQASIKITGFFFRSLSGSQQFYRIIGFQNHIWRDVKWPHLNEVPAPKNLLLGWVAQVADEKNTPVNNKSQAGELRAWSYQWIHLYLWFLSAVSGFCRGLMVGWGKFLLSGPSQPFFCGFMGASQKYILRKKPEKNSPQNENGWKYWDLSGSRTQSFFFFFYQTLKKHNEDNEPDV